MNKRIGLFLMSIMLVVTMAIPTMAQEVTLQDEWDDFPLVDLFEGAEWYNDDDYCHFFSIIVPETGEYRIWDEPLTNAETDPSLAICEDYDMEDEVAYLDDIKDENGQLLDSNFDGTAYLEAGHRYGCNLTFYCGDGAIVKMEKVDGEDDPDSEKETDIANLYVDLDESSFAYTGKAIKPYIVITGDDGELVKGVDYTVTYANNINVGKATVTVKGIGEYEGEQTLSYTITKANNPVKAKGKTVTLKASKVKKKAQSVAASKAYTVSKAQGKVTYKKASGDKKITIASNGKVTVKKGLKKGTYKVKVKVKAAGNGNYKAATKTATVTVKVK